MQVNLEDVSFRHPSTSLVVGPSKSGKTVLVMQLLNRHNLLFPKITKPRVGWYSATPVEKRQFSPSLNVAILKQLPTSLKELDILVIDDFLNELSKSDRLASIFTKESHHDKCSVMFLSQNLFIKSQQFRTVSLNADYIILLKSFRDKTVAFNLARQICPLTPKSFLELYEAATKEPYSYLRIDNTPVCRDELRFLGNLTTEPFQPLAYILDNGKNQAECKSQELSQGDQASSENEKQAGSAAQAQRTFRK